MTGTAICCSLGLQCTAASGSRAKPHAAWMVALAEPKQTGKQEDVQWHKAASLHIYRIASQRNRSVLDTRLQVRRPKRTPARPQRPLSLSTQHFLRLSQLPSLSNGEHRGSSRGSALAVTGDPGSAWTDPTLSAISQRWCNTWRVLASTQRVSLEA